MIPSPYNFEKTSRMLKNKIVRNKRPNFEKGVAKKQRTSDFPKNKYLKRFGVLYFLVTPVLRFALLPYCGQN